MGDSPAPKLLDRAIGNIKGILSGSTKAAVPDPLPDILPLESIANITEQWEAVERFPACLLVTESVLSNETEPYTVTQVVFKIKSNDQGWCNEDNFEGEYEGSWTWFEVAILRPVTGADRISPRDKRNITSEPCIKKYLDDNNIPDKLHLFIDPERNTGPLWHLQRNRRGSDEPHLHTIIWNRDAKVSETESIGWDFDAKTGAGSGVNFVSSLQKGDRVAIIARAKQSGSVNYISEAKVEIRFGGFKPASDPPAKGSTTSLSARSDTARVAGDSASAERRTSSSTVKSSNPRVDQADEPTQSGVSPQYLGVQRSTASPLPRLATNNNANANSPIDKELIVPPATSIDAAGGQTAGEAQLQDVVKVEPPAATTGSSTDVARHGVAFSAPNTGSSDPNDESAVPPKSPAKPNRKGSGGGKPWDFIPGMKKKSTNNMKAAGNNTQAQRGSVVGGAVSPSPPVLDTNKQPAPPTRDDTGAGAKSDQPASPSSPANGRPKSLLGGWSDKVNFRGKRGKTPTTLPSDANRVDESEAGGAA